MSARLTMTTDPREIEEISGYCCSPDLLQDRVVLITGAGDGIGRAAALACAAHGATVVLLGRTLAKLESLYDEIESAGHPQPAIYPLDLEGASPGDYGDLANTLEQELGALHGVLHNAAAVPQLGPLEAIDPRDWYRAMQVNASAPFLLTQSCMDLLRAANGASVVFTLDEPERLARAYWGAYAVSKQAASGLMRILADELENTSQVRVNAVIPCPVRTGLRARTSPGSNLDALPTAEEIMQTYLFLLGSDGAATHGKTFRAVSASKP